MKKKKIFIAIIVWCFMPIFSFCYGITSYNVVKEYDQEKNCVKVSVQSQIEIKQMKPTWKLDESKKIYQKEYRENGTYATLFTDVTGKEEMVSFVIEEIDEEGPEVTVQKTYDEITNTVRVQAIANEKVRETKPTWTLDETQMVYEKIYDKNGSYQTKIQDIYGNESTFSFVIDEIKSGFTVEKEYDEIRNCVVVSVLSKSKLQEVKPTWKLGESSKIYQKEYRENGTYATLFTDVTGKEEMVSFVIEEIDEEGPEVTVQKTYDEITNTVRVQAMANEKVRETKPTWTLDETQTVYEKIYDKNGSYQTKIQDIYGNESTFSFVIDEIKSGFTVEKEYDEIRNCVVVSVLSKSKLQEVKPTWKLEESGKIYQKEYRENGMYATLFTDVTGKEEMVSFVIEEIDEEGPEITIQKTYDEITNTVRVQAIANEKVRETKPTWTLDETQMVYEKIYDKNGSYQTKIQDIYGNESTFSFVIDEIKSGFTVEKEYDEIRNCVVVSVLSKSKLQEVKPTWKLGESGKIYQKEYRENGTYATLFTDVTGKEEMVSFVIEEIDKEGPEITVQKEYEEETNTVIIRAISNEKLGETKPTWTLDESQMIYEKRYESNGNYRTNMKDIYGNESYFSFTIDEIMSGFTIEKVENYLGNTVVVSVVSKSKLQEVKPTWTLDESGKIYSKMYAKNGNYQTTFMDVNGREETISFLIDEIGKKESLTHFNLSSYLIKEYEAKLANAKKLQNKNTFTFSFITDLHINNQYVTMNNINAFCRASQEDFVEAAVVAGDLYSAYQTNRKEGLWYLNHVHDKISSGISKNVLYTKGNHDCNAKLGTKERISNESYQAIFSESVQGQVYHEGDENHSYYYIDYEPYQVRLCVLNSFCGEGEEPIFGQDQLSFVANQVLRFTEEQKGWHVLFIAHTIQEAKDLNQFHDIVTAYQKGESTQLLKENITYSEKGSLIGVFTGHHHEDRLLQNESYTDFEIQRGFNLKSEFGSKEELSFDLITIDLEAKKVYETKFGRGEDRTFSFE